MTSSVHQATESRDLIKSIASVQFTLKVCKVCRVASLLQRLI